MAIYNISGVNIDETAFSVYDVTDYGISTSSQDNTAAMQALIDLVYTNGGGTIFIPNGTYLFASESATVATPQITRILIPKNYVSIIGENSHKTILKVTGYSASGASLFGHHSSIDTKLVGCTFSSFTVNMSDCTIGEYSWRGKAFMANDVEDCIYRDLRLIGTPATSLGIDCLHNVTIDGVYVYKGGRLWSNGGYGGAGIGIGTGVYDDESFIIRNCICDDCGNFGIFLENQVSHSQNPPQYIGQIIANNIVIHGRGRGIGVRTNSHVLISGNNVYDCVSGIYLDSGCTNIMISNNLVSDCVNGIHFGSGTAIGNGTDIACTYISVIGNTLRSNTNNIVKTIAPTNSVEANNVINGALS